MTYFKLHLLQGKAQEEKYKLIAPHDLFLKRAYLYGERHVLYKDQRNKHVKEV